MIWWYFLLGAHWFSQRSLRKKSDAKRRTAHAVPSAAALDVDDEGSRQDQKQSTWVRRHESRLALGWLTTVLLLFLWVRATVKDSLPTLRVDTAFLVTTGLYSWVIATGAFWLGLAGGIEMTIGISVFGLFSSIFVGLRFGAEGTAIWAFLLVFVDLFVMKKHPRKAGSDLLKAFTSFSSSLFPGKH